MLYKVSCIIPNGHPAVSYNVNETDTVSELKKQIKLDNKLVFPSAELTLFELNIDSSGEDRYIEEVKLLAENLAGLTKLESMSSMVDVFKGAVPPKNKVHILVQLPKGESYTGTKLTMLMTRSQNGRLRRKTAQIW